LALEEVPVPEDPWRIDVHHHVVPPAFVEAVARSGRSVRTPAWSPESALTMMDRAGVKQAITSLSTPGVQLGDPELARSLARDCNDYFAWMKAQRPDRFGAFATLNLPDVPGACAEAEYALDKLGLDGVNVLTHYDGRYLGHPVWRPLWKILDERACVVHVHPTIPPYGSLADLDAPPFLVEFLFETTRTAVDLIYKNVIDDFPNIKFILSHAGGTLPYVAWRVADISWRQLSERSMSPGEQQAHQYAIPLLERLTGAVKQETLLERIGRFWYDTALSPAPHTLRSIVAVAGLDHILFGSDWPYAPEKMTRDSLDALAAGGWSAEELVAIGCGNASRLLSQGGAQSLGRDDVPATSRS
jgi:predicted TIM-barrel fold metal-dependent hydrolase